MTEQQSSEQLTSERQELTRALNELREWKLLRRSALKEYEELIQHTLSTGRLTCRREAESRKKYLTERMVATIALDCNMLKRSILIMESREHRIRKRLSEIISMQSPVGSSSSSSSPEIEENKSA